jgi:sensor histidine kinase YesM
MWSKRKHIEALVYEMVFQTIVFAVLFVFYSYNQDGIVSVLPYKLAFFANYALSGLFIGYFLVPKLYSKGRYFWFVLGVSFLVLLVIVVDEFVLEQIFFPDTRGTYFPGVLFTLLETVPLITLFVGFKFAWDYHQKQKEIENLEQLVRDSELQFLRSQINPHFLFNNLNNLYVLTEEKSAKAPQVILELSSVLRYMLYDCKEKFTPFEKEISNLKHYIALNELQIGDRGMVRFNLDSLMPGFCIAPLILVVFVENAFKHSMASQVDGIKIDVTIDINELGLLVFRCANTYLKDTNTQQLGHGIGLENVRKRLELLYPGEHQLNINSVKGIYEVVLSIQLNRVGLC